MRLSLWRKLLFGNFRLFTTSHRIQPKQLQIMDRSNQTCQQNNQNPLTFYWALSCSVQEHAVALHCLPRPYLLYFYRRLSISQPLKVWSRFLPYPSLISLLVHKHPTQYRDQKTLKWWYIGHCNTFSYYLSLTQIFRPCLFIKLV